MAARHDMGDGIGMLARQLATVFVVCAGLPAPCWAAGGTQIVTVRYVAPAECPGEDSFQSRLFRYASVKASARGSVARTSIAVEIAPGGEGFSGRLEVVTPERTVSRQLTDEHCDALVEALALVSAIATDRLQHEVGQPHRVGLRSPEATDRSRHQVSVPYAEKRGSPDLKDLEVARGPRSSWALGAVGGVSSDLSPAALITLGVYGSRRQYHWGLWGHYAATLNYAQTKWLPYDSGKARFRWYGGRLSACPLGDASEVFSYGACAVAQLGWLHGRGTSARGGRSDGGPWLAPGLGLTANLLLGPIELGWDAGLVAPLVRDRYFFTPDETVFRAKWLGYLAEVRLGWVIW